MKTLALLHMLLLPLASLADDSQAQREQEQSQSPSTDADDCQNPSSIAPQR